MKLLRCIFIFFIMFSFTSCSQYTISNKYYSNNDNSKKLDVNIEINNSTKNLTLDEITFEISNINTHSSELQKIYQESNSNEEFITNLNDKITNTLDNLGFNEEVIYNCSQKSKDRNILFTKRSQFGDINTKTLLITTTYFNSNNEFDPKNIAMIFELMRLFENFDKNYHLSILFINNSLNLENSIDSTIDELLYLDLLGIIDLRFENILNKVNVLNLDKESKLSRFINDSIDYNSLNFVNCSEIINKETFNNISKNNIDFVKVVSETNATDMTKCANLLINIIADILNKPLVPSISVNDSMFRINLDLTNHNSVKKILYKLNNGEYNEITNDSVIEFNDSIELSLKLIDLFDNEGNEINIKLF